MKLRKRKWTAEQLIKAAANSFSYRQILSKLKLREAGGNYEQIKKYLSELKIDISHFKGCGWNRGMHCVGIPRIPLEKILINGSNFQSFKLKKRLFTAKLKKPACEFCGWAKKTLEGYLPLELDHINGNRHDNRIENLRILCPNCHSLTTTYRSRKRK